jgi:Glycosyltransferase family 87
MSALSNLRAARVERRLELRRLVWAVACSATIASVVILGLFNSAGTVSHAHFGFDFKGDLYAAGRAILHGVSPYHPALLQAEAAIVKAGRGVGAYFPASPRYPPPVLLAVVPLSLLPVGVATIAFLLLSVAAVIVALRMLGVRDWRCVLLALVSAPTAQSIWIGNISAVLLIGAALVWRWRARLWPVAVATASTIAAKLILWPFAIWLVVTRRRRAAALAVSLVLAEILLAWAVIAFAGMTAYPHMLENITSIGESRGSSLVAFLLSLGVSVNTARVIAFACAALLVVAAWKLAQRPEGERQAFGLVVIAGLTATPVVWQHYLVLLYVPIALLSPRLSWLWLAPMLAMSTPSINLAIELLVASQLCLPLITSAKTAWPSKQRESVSLSTMLGLDEGGASSALGRTQPASD